MRGGTQRRTTDWCSPIIRAPMLSYYRGAVVLSVALLMSTGSVPRALVLPAHPALTALPVIEANDNRKPGGVLRNDTLTIKLVVQMARWYPEASDGPYVDVAALAEEGKTPTVPGPLIRVPTGTTIVATVRNELSDSTAWVRGMATRPAPRDSIPARPAHSCSRQGSLARTCIPSNPV